ncbi:MAG: hypothetical protein M1832_002972 [Thelocarpon impressellum]|nr:MAG: hypothetical protein M1832_002972 [Thelocarpon impressellum]
MPVVEMPVVSKLKRGRRDDDHPKPTRVEKRSRGRAGSRTDTRKAKRIDSKEGALIEQQLRVERGERTSSRSELEDINMKVPAVTEVPGTRSHPLGEGRARLTMVGSSGASTLTPLQQSIESQFSLEILLKHQELRLIEQELAKCQIAYEQLRRCSLVPYTDDEAVSATADCADQQADGAPDLANGALRWPASPSITNGPYTRHYGRWLISDPRFDGAVAPGEATHEAAVASSRVGEGRVTRGSLPEIGTTAGKSRSRGGAAASKLQALSTGVPQAKDKGGPLILKRSSDGQLVKLVCLDCHRGDFSSAQGFINHCRIAHHRGFESHDAAASACGEIVEVDEAGNVVGEGDAGQGSTITLVHPLIRSAPSTRTVPIRSSSRSDISDEKTGASASGSTHGGPKETSKTDARPKRAARRQGRNGSNAKVAPVLIPSPQTPHLSALMQNRGLGGDLSGLVGEAKTQYDLGLSSSSDDDYEDMSDEDESGETARPGDEHDGRLRFRCNHDGASDEREASAFPKGGRMPARAGMSPAPLSQPSSSKGVEPRRPVASSGLSSRTLQAPSGAATSPSPPKPRQLRRNAAEAAPSTTPTAPRALGGHALDAAVAPSLVSDDGEYEAHSESETPGSENADDVRYGVAFDVEEGDEAGQSDETVATDPDLAHAQAPGSKGGLPRRTAMRKDGASVNGKRGDRKERHVTFMNPVKETEVKGRGARRAARK